MKKVREIIALLLFVSVVLSFFACRDPHLTLKESNTTYEGVTLTIIGVDYLEDHISLRTELSNETDHEVIYGAEYFVERNVGGDWISCANRDIAFIEIAYVLPKSSTQSKAYSLRGFDVTNDGTYRLRITCYVHEPGEVRHCSLTAIFGVEGGRTIAGYHELTYNIGTEFYEKPKSYYKAEEVVTIKIKRIANEEFTLYLNGEALERDEVNSSAYWQYTFVMPHAPARLTSDN